MDIFERPSEFFRKEHSYAVGFSLFLIAVIVNSVMSELLLQYHFVDFGRILDPYFAISAKIILSIAGYFVITSLCVIPLKLIHGQNLKGFYKVSVYSLVVLIFLWIPHILVAAVILAWFIMLMIFGMKQHNSLSYKKGLIVVIIFIILVIGLAFIVHDYVPIFPWKIG